MVEIILFVFLFIILFILSFKIRVEILDFESMNFDKNRVNVKIKLYVFKVLKLIEFDINETGIKYFNGKKEIKYKYEFIEFLKLLLHEKNSSIFKIFSIENYRKLNIKIKDFDLKLNIGILENMITSFCVTILSSIISVFLSKHIKIYNKDKINYCILPVFDDLHLSLKLKLSFEIYGINFFKLILKNRDNLKCLYLYLKNIGMSDFKTKDVKLKVFQN